VAFLVALTNSSEQISKEYGETPYFFDIHFNIILPSKPTSSKWSLPFTILIAFQKL
jgi:hypothetical protein